MTAPLIAVLDYGIGNLRSAQKALQKVGADARLTSDAALVRDAHAVVLPGVGAFGACMTALRESGLEPLVHERIAGGKPFMGICVGMQMLFDDSEENPGARGLGVVPVALEHLRTVGDDLTDLARRQQELRWAIGQSMQQSFQRWAFLRHVTALRICRG